MFIRQGPFVREGHLTKLKCFGGVYIGQEASIRKWVAIRSFTAVIIKP